LPRGYGPRDVAWIGWAPPFEHLPPNPELSKLIPDFRPAFAADDFLVQLRAAEAGLGAIFLARVRTYPRAAPLQELALDLGPLRRSLHLVCARSALAVPRVRAVADLLARALETTPPMPPRKAISRTKS
jgi:DNA-binding transcriptional LysR family regulator